MGCRVGNRSSHRRSFPVSNGPTEWENTGRPVMRSMLCNILAAGSGRMGECGRPVTNPFDGTGVVLGAQLTRRNLYHRVVSSKSRFLNSISSVGLPSRFHIPITPFLRAYQFCRSLFTDTSGISPQLWDKFHSGGFMDIL
jgi:hypothetical protein